MRFVFILQTPSFNRYSLQDRKTKLNACSLQNPVFFSEIGQISRATFVFTKPSIGTGEMN